MPTRLRRRAFLGAGIGALATVSLTGCDSLGLNPADEKRRSGRGPAGNRRQAPALQERVTGGGLPALDRRLPRDPLVVPPVDRPGTYGGELRSALLGPGDTGWLGRTIGYENLIRWDTRDFWHYRPNVAASVDVTDGGARYVFHLRHGQRWSDGTQFTADDVVFAYDDVLRNTEVSPEGPPTWMAPGGVPGRVTKLDERTVEMTFDSSNSLFLINLASSNGEQLTAYPRHYLRRYHKRYNADVSRLVAEEKATDWAELFTNKADPWANPEVPTLHAWTVTTPLGSASRVVARRNPYYWKTDPDRRQLPYIDTVEYAVTGKTETLLLNVLHGDIDFHLDYFNTMKNKPVVARNQRPGHYRIITLIPGNMNDMGISLNLTHSNAVKRETFQNKDFRIGLSYAINRREVIDTVFQRQGEPWQCAPRPDEHSLYDERLAKQYTDYDPDRANAHLDRAGFSKRDADGFRLGPDGRRIRFSVLVAPDFRIEHVDGMQLVKGYWAQVGIDIAVTSASSTLVEERRSSNNFDAIVWDCGAGWRADVFLRPYWYTPIGSTRFAPLWALWYQTRGEQGERPPGPTRRQMELYDQIQQTIEEDRQLALMRDLLAISREEFYVIGTSLPKGWYGIAADDLRNVSPKLRDGGTYSCPASTDLTQYFLSNR